MKFNAYYFSFYFYFNLGYKIKKSIETVPLYMEQDRFS